MDRSRLRLSVFIPMSIIFLAFIVIGIFATESLYNVETNIVNFAFRKFGWLFQITSVLFLVICTYLALSKYGDIKFGGPDAKPTLNYWNWFTITATAGIGGGILFFGTAEPITHFMDPPEVLGIEPGTESAAMFAMAQSFIEWTFIPYAMYTLVGIGVGFAVYNMNLPYQVSSILYPIFGEKIKGAIGDIVDNLCLFAIAGCVAAVLGPITAQLGEGIRMLTGISNGQTLWIILLIVIVATYIISSYTGLNKGIRWLADKNTKLFIGLMLFVFIFGPTAFILSLSTQSFGHFLSNFFEQTLYVSPIDNSEWPKSWPIYYWATWLGFAPITGMFMARISKGRTIKQFVTVNILGVAALGIIWFSIFGGSAIFLQLNGSDIWGSIQTQGTEASVYAFFTNFPISKIVTIAFIIAIFISIVTLADSMTSTVASLTIKRSNVEKEPPGVVKIFWGFVIASTAFVGLITTGQGDISTIEATKQLAVVVGFPIMFFMLLISFSIMKMIISHKKYDVVSRPGEKTFNQKKEQ